MIKIDSTILNSEAFTSLLEKVESLTFKKGELILKGGEICKYLFIVEHGLLRNFYYDGKGNDITHWFAKEKMIVTAPESFFNQEKSLFNIEAIEDSKVIAISHEILEQAFENSKTIERFGRILTTQIMITLGRKIIDLQTKNAKARYNELIKNYPDIFRRVNLGHIASYLGMTQQSLSRIRNNSVK